MEVWELVARESIRDCIARYNANGDSGRIDEMVSVFAPDGIMETGSGRYEGRDAIRGCALRVLRREVQTGARADRGRTWIKVATLRLDVDLEELEELRLAVRRKIREIEDEHEEPSLREGRG